MDITVDPPSYAVDLGESVRETEAHRLQPRQAGEALPSVPAQRPLAVPTAVPQQAALEEEDDDFGDFADAAEAGQPGVSPSVPQSHANGDIPSANGFNSYLNGFTHHQPHSNGFSHAPGLGLAAAARLPNGATAPAPAEASQKDDEVDFGDFADADMAVPGPSDAAAECVGHAYSAHTAHSGQPWSGVAGFGGPAAAQFPDLPVLRSLHADAQHARGPSVDSTASLGSMNGLPHGVLDGDLPSGTLASPQPEMWVQCANASCALPAYVCLTEGCWLSGLRAGCLCYLQCGALSAAVGVYGCH